jgi:ankyrin repeat protein
LNHIFLPEKKATDSQRAGKFIANDNQEQKPGSDNDFSKFGSGHKFKPEIDFNKKVEADFIEAVRNGNAQEVEGMIEAGIDVNYQDSNGMTALHYAAEKGARPCLRLLVNNGECNYLLENTNGRTASELAYIWAKDYGVGRLLVKKEASQADNSPSS